MKAAWRTVELRTEPDPFGGWATVVRKAGRLDHPCWALEIPRKMRGAAGMEHRVSKVVEVTT